LHTATATPRRSRVYYGWWIVVGTFVLQAVQSSLLFLSFGAYLVELQRYFGWTKSQISGAFSLARLESGFLGPIQGWMIDNWGARAVLRLGTLLFGGSFMLLALVDSLFWFYAVFLMVAIGSSLAGFLTFNATIASWFIRKRARAMAIAQTGMGLGGVLALAVAWSLVTFGWRWTAFASGALVIAIGLPASQLFRGTPEQYGMLPDGRRPEPRPASGAGARAASDGEVHFTVRQAMRQRAFWLISLGHGTALLVVSGVQVHLIAFLEETAGWSLPAATTMVTLITMTSIVGQLSGGFLGDRFDKRLIAGTCMLGHGAAMLLLTWSASWPVVTFASVLHGLSWGARGPLMTAIRADYFGRRNFASIMGFSSMIVMLGTVLGPLFLAWMYDALGNYRVAFFTIGVITGAGCLFFFLTPKRPVPAPTPQ